MPGSAKAGAVLKITGSGIGVVTCSLLPFGQAPAPQLPLALSVVSVVTLKTLFKFVPGVTPAST